MKTETELMQCGTLAMEFMLLRYGPISESDDRDRWNERLGIVMDAYHEILSGNIKPPNAKLTSGAHYAPKPEN